MAGSRIKGITVEIGSDTTKLQTALKGVNSEIKNTQWCCTIKVDTLFSRILIYNHNQYENGRKNMAQNQKSYDTEFKAQAVKLAQEIGGHKAARELGIPSVILQQISLWKSALPI